MQISSSPVSLFVDMVASQGDASDYVTVVGSLNASQAEPELTFYEIVCPFAKAEFETLKSMVQEGGRSTSDRV
jgi:hypothetical protein